MATSSPPAAGIDPRREPPCLHRRGCACRRPSLGLALVASAAVQLILALITLLAGSPVVGLVACGAMGACMMVAVVAEIVAFYRIGLAEPDANIGRHRAAGHRPSQVTW